MSGAAAGQLGPPSGFRLRALQYLLGAEGFSRFAWDSDRPFAASQAGIIEYSTSQGLADRTYLRLTHAACKSLFTELEISLEEEIPITLKKICSHIRISAPKHFFYNAAESRQVDTWLTCYLRSVLLKSAAAIRKGLRSGFAALFYGAPGTGKTETVHQLALGRVRHPESQYRRDQKHVVRESEKMYSGNFRQLPRKW